jgi:ATP-dependent DNA ligase
MATGSKSISGTPPSKCSPGRKVAADAWHINAGSAIIDGEVVVPAEDGTTDFSVLQHELKGLSKKIVMVAFDLLYLNGYDLPESAAVRA